MDSYMFDVAVSYASEQRPFIERFVKKLRLNSLSVYYDRDAQVSMVGKLLDQELYNIYLKRSRHCVLFISKEYINKPITRYESQIILSETLFNDGFMYVFKFDDVTLPGLNRNFIYSSIKDFPEPESYADFMFEVIQGNKPAAISLDEDYLFSELSNQLIGVTNHIASYMGYKAVINKKANATMIKLIAQSSVILHIQIKKAIGKSGVIIWSNRGLHQFDEHAYQGYLEWSPEECSYLLLNKGLIFNMEPLMTFSSISEICECIKAEYIMTIG